MDRWPEHFDQDPSLRPDFCGQESFDEYKERVLSDRTQQGRHAAQFSNEKPDTSTTEAFGKSLDDLEQAIAMDWYETLHPETTGEEMLYLSGVVDKQEREKKGEIADTYIYNAAVAKGWFGFGISEN